MPYNFSLQLMPTDNLSLPVHLQSRIRLLRPLALAFQTQKPPLVEHWRKVPPHKLPR